MVSVSATSVFAQSQYEIPEWIKNNVKWWTEEKIDDQSFVSGIEFLISDGIIDVSITEKTVSPTDEIPSWVRTNTKWWADGLIPNSDFVKGIEYLVNSGIIQVEQTVQSQIDPPSLEIDPRPNDDAVDIIQESWMCSGNARCFTGTVTSVIDGDTIKINGQSIRFAMASAPELNEPGGIEAREFIETICSVGSIATVDEDDGQTEGSYGRILGVVYCNGFNLNQDLLDTGYGYLISDFCDKSEFATEYWAQKHGCSTSSEPECPISYPYLWSDDFCYDLPEFLDNGCPRNYPYLWSDGSCYTVSEYLENGCPRGYPYIWSDGLCYNIPEPAYEESPPCDPSYPDVCIASYPPDLDCDEIPYTDFRVYQPDPHGFDVDYDGIGCETSKSNSQSSQSSSQQLDCDPSYPDFCIPPPPPDLDCGDIPQKRFTVLQPDPHRFDGDKDGIGCES